MNIWTVRFDVVNYASALLVEEDDVDISGFIPNWPDFEGQPQSGNWRNFKARMKQNKPIANFTDLDPGVLVCDNYATSRIEKFLPKEVEILPIEIDDLDMKLINVINVIDCLDEKSSIIKYYPNSKDIREIKRYFFDESLLKNTFLFKIPQFSRTEIFSTEAFYDLVMQFQLTGLIFQLIYSS